MPGAQQIGYMNIVPQCTSTEESFKYRPEFASYTDTLANFNEGLVVHPLPGRVISIETREMKVGSSMADLDPDSSTWKEGGSSTLFVFATRLFYEIAEPDYEQIGTSVNIIIITFSRTTNLPQILYNRCLNQTIILP